MLVDYCEVLHVVFNLLGVQGEVVVPNYLPFAVVLRGWRSVTFVWRFAGVESRDRDWDCGSGYRLGSAVCCHCRVGSVGSIVSGVVELCSDMGVILVIVGRYPDFVSV